MNMTEPPKDVIFDPNKQVSGMMKGSKEIRKYFKGKTSKK